MKRHISEKTLYDKHREANVLKKPSDTEFYIKVAKVGCRNKIQNISDGFVFENQSYRLLIDINVLNVWLKDISLVPEFGLKTFDDTQNEITLWIVLKSVPFQYYCQPQPNSEAAKRLIGEFFNVHRKILFDESKDAHENNQSNIKSFSMIVENLYAQLETKHETDDFFDQWTSEYIQHKHLRVVLKPYQIKTIKWMLNRELVRKHYAGDFLEIKKRSTNGDDGSTKFFFNSQTISLTTNPTICIPLPTGGILADEMGLGKTIELLDLILLNPRPLDESEVDGPLEKIKKTIEKADKKQVHCLCAQIKAKDTVSCTKCFLLQHRKCVSQQNSDITPDDSYMCPACWGKEKPIASKTTFIVSPRSIKGQWKSETDNRVQSGAISLYQFDGTKSCKWMNPMELASYDIILTDYETLRIEYGYSDLNSSDRVLRNRTNSRMRHKSALLCLNFWRICLDESQMVTEMTTKHAQVAAEFSAVHRWACTGTPIEKSINDLFGLISFIKYAPYNESRRWHQAAGNLEYHYNFKQFVSILHPIMWRTCKSQAVMDQMNVPKQTERVHFVELSQLNRFNYNKERDECRDAFRKLIQYYGLDTPLTNLSPSTLDHLMEPVRVLRRNCSILHVSDKDGNTIVMRPSQMIQHLINTNELDAKSELQNIATRLKSFAAFSIGIHQNSATVAKITLDNCRKVLEWAKKYETEPTIIESLLQIRTIHYVIALNGIMNIDVKKYNADLNAMESLFHKRQFDLITNFQAEREKEINKFTDFEGVFTKHCHEWVTTALNDEKTQVQLLLQIKNTISTSYENVSVASIFDISKMLSNWTNNFLDKRKKFKKAFAELTTLAAEADSKFGKEKRSSELFSKIFDDALNCHLNDETNDDSNLSNLFNHSNHSNEKGPSPSKRAKRQCLLCSVKRELAIYSLVVTDYAYKLKKKAGFESINPSMQESMLKVILQGNEYAGHINIKVGVTILTALENFRDEFEKYKDVLSQITKNISSFHNVQKRKPIKPTITPLEIPSLLNSIELSEFQCVRKIRVNRYLNCLKEDNDIEECPICMTTYEQEFLVFECGHQSCGDCFLQLNKNYQFECPFCREKQFHPKPYHFTVDKSEKFTNSSTKIEHIVREVFNLKRNDPKVKILIFSQWVDILYTLRKELNSNEIPSRSITGITKIQNILQEFKDPDSKINCLLMPYKFGSKGLNLTEATHVFLVEPIINRGEELQTIGRVHRIGQTRETVVHRFITKNTIEETMYKAMSTTGILSEKCTVKTMLDLFADAEDIN